MMDAPHILDALRGASLTIWVIVCLSTVRAFVSHLFGHGTGDDSWWSLIGLVGVVFASWGAKNMFLPSTHSGPEYSATCAAQVLTCVVGLCVLRKRIGRIR